MGKAAQTPHPSLYDQDYYAWLEQQAAALRAGRIRSLDLANLTEGRP